MKKSTNKGISPAVVIIIILLIIGIGGGLWYFLVRKEEVNTNTVNIAPVSNTNTSLDTSDWQIFTNNNYHYKLLYPVDWHYIADAMTGPIPPVTAFFSTVEDTTIIPYASFSILVSEMTEESLDEHAELVSLVADGYEKTDFILSGQPAIRLERNDNEMYSGVTIYVAKDGYVYRLVLGGTDFQTHSLYEDECETIADSFTFLEPLAADFSQTGTLTKPAGSDNYFVLWEEPGNPALTKELVFNQNDYTSICILDEDRRGHCTDLLENQLFGLGDNISVEGILSEDGKVDVLTIILQ